MPDEPEGVPKGEPNSQILVYLKKVETLITMGNYVSAKFVAKSIQEDEWRDRAYGMIAVSQALQRDYNGAKQTIAAMKFPLLKVLTLSQVGIFETLHGATASRQTLDKATKLALTISHNVTRDFALIAVINTEVQHQQFDRAKRLLLKVQDPLKRYIPLARIARGEAETGNLRSAQTTLGKSLKDAKGISPGYARDVYFRDVFYVLTRLNDLAGALQIARGMYESYNRANALAEVAALQAKGGSPVNARRTVQEAKQIVPQIQDSHAKDTARFRIVIALIALRDKAEASRLAGEIIDRDIKAKALREIAKAN